MTEPAITPELVQKHNLTPDEYRGILAILGREPSYTELGIFSVMWSEHCSYKNTRPLLKTFPTKSPKILVGAGAEVIHVSAGMAPSGHYSFLPAAIPQGYNVYLAEGIKEAVGPDVPVIAVGAIENPIFAEEVLARGKVDLVAIGRPLFADPEMPNKARAGRLDEILPCLRCSKSAAVWPEDMRCVVNPAVGKEKLFDEALKPVAEPKKVLVIGAGPGGMEAACLAATRGHSVTLMEKSEQVGGKIHLAMRPPDKSRLQSAWLEHFQRELKRLQVNVMLNHEVTVEEVAALAPDEIIVATGGKPLIPRSIAGTDLPNVFVADDVLWDRVAVGDRVAIIGGSSMGIETAEFILDRRPDTKVLVIEMLHEILLDISHDAVLAALDKLAKADFRYLTETRVMGIEQSDGRLNVRVKRYNLDDVLTGFDTVVLAMGVASNNALGLALEERFSNVHLIGDCAGPGDYRKAVHDAAAVALEI